MRYAESDALLDEAVITEAHLAPVDAYLADAKMDWTLTAAAISQHTGTPVAKVRLVLNKLVEEGYFSATESFVCPDEDCNFKTARDVVEQARMDGEESPCDGCTRDLAAETDMDVVQVYRSLGQLLEDA